MKFSLNLVEIYHNMQNEYGEPLSLYMKYDEFVDKIKRKEYSIFISPFTGNVFLEVYVEEAGE